MVKLDGFTHCATRQFHGRPAPGRPELEAVARVRKAVNSERRLKYWVANGCKFSTADLRTILDALSALEADKAALVEALEIISKHGYGAAFDWSPQGSEQWDGIVTRARATLAKHGGVK